MFINITIHYISYSVEVKMKTKECKICQNIPEVKDVINNPHNELPKFVTEFRDTGDLIEGVITYYDLQLIKYHDKYCLYHYEEISSFENENCFSIINYCPVCGRKLSTNE